MDFSTYLFTFIFSVAMRRKPSLSVCAQSNLDNGKYVGCFIDRKIRTLPDAYLYSEDMENELCIQFCIGGGYLYAGTEAMDECYCGNDPYWVLTEIATMDAQYTDNTDCQVTCKGDSLQICGGGWRLSVYRTGIITSHIYFKVSSFGLQAQTYHETIITRERMNIMCAILCHQDNHCSVFSVTNNSCEMYSLKDLYQGYKNGTNAGVFVLRIA